MNRVDLTGKKFGRLTVTGDWKSEHDGRERRIFWLCICSCNGKSVWVKAGSLTSENTQSCGCLILESRTKHGFAQKGKTSKEYRAWVNLKGRCTNPKHSRFADWGGRGIKVDPRFLKCFEAFFAEVGPAPSSKHSIDRIDNNKGYESGNIHWGTPKQQSRNNRRNRIVTIEGFTGCLAEACERFGLKYVQVYHDLDRGKRLEAYGIQIASVEGK